MLGEVRRVRLKGISPILGSISPDKEIYTKFIATKTESIKEYKRALEDEESVLDTKEKYTCFYRDKEGNPILKDYQIKGFLKESAKALRGTFDVLGSGVTSQGKIDNLIFIKGVNISLTRDGKKIESPDDFLERPLRAMTMQGPRVSLAKSELIDEGWECEFEIQFLNDVSSGKSKTYTWEIIEKLFEYGELKGLLQWRNGGYGRFTFEWIK